MSLQPSKLSNRTLNFLGAALNRIGIPYATGFTRLVKTIYASNDPIKLYNARKKLMELAPTFRPSKRVKAQTAIRWATEKINALPHGIETAISEAAMHLPIPQVDIDAELESLKRRMQDQDSDSALRDPLPETLIDRYTGLSLPTYSETLEILRQVEKNNKTWHRNKSLELISTKFYDAHGIYEFLNKEYVEALSKYIASRIKNDFPHQADPITILEVGAGNGRLSYFLQKHLDEFIPGKVNIIAIDSGLQKINPVHEVEKLDYKDALSRYQPQFVICSWMQRDNDFSADFRNTASVTEYILIGDQEVCGDTWNTWGRSGVIMVSKKEKSLPPHREGGFQSKELEDLSALQLCRTDCFYENSNGEENLSNKSGTFSFRRT